MDATHVGNQRVKRISVRTKNIFLDFRPGLTPVLIPSGCGIVPQPPEHSMWKSLAFAAG
jgi:hypothetical protein